jgi:dipeptidyl aminopeptidase/acylaminoacyl peptidase
MATPTSGEYILYGGSSGQTWVIRPDGTGKRKLADMMPVSWSHDGSVVHLLKASGCTQTLANVSVFSGSVQPIAAALEVGDSGFTWSADDSQIAFFRYVTEHLCSPGGPTDDTVHLMIMKADGSNVHAVGPVLPDAGQVGWLPDGKSVVVNKSDQMNSIAGPLIRVTLSDGTSTDVTTGSCQEYQFAPTPDGERIAWTCDDGAHVADISGGGDHLLGHPGWHDHLLVWSRDSLSLAILRVEPTTVHLAVWKSPAALPTDLYQPLNDNVTGPKFSWSPDSKVIACTGISGEIVLVKADGSGSVVVPGSTGSWAADWQP